MKWKEGDESWANAEVKGIERELEEASKGTNEEAHILMSKLMHRVYALEDKVAEALFSTTLRNE